MQRKKNRKAFTLVELVIVIAVVAVLAAVLIPTFGGIIEKANDSKAMQTAKNAYTQYVIEYATESRLPEYMVYDADGRFVALRNGTPVGVYKTPEEALKAMIDNPDLGKLTATHDGKLFTYGDFSEKERLTGKKISFMGDSITTYLNWSNNTDYNSTLGGYDERNNRVYYERDNQKGHLSSVYDTWWMQTVKKLGLHLCVNNSWTGSRVTKEGGENKYGCGTRTGNLHNDLIGEYPDIIVVYMGTNDVSAVTVGSFDSIDEIYNAQTRDYTGNINQFAPAYATMVHKIKANYPEADIYLCTVDNYAFNNGKNPVAFNAMIEKIAEYFDCSVVDFYNGTSITPSTVKEYLADSYLHPNAKGMTQMYECVKNALAENYQIIETNYAPRPDDEPTFGDESILDGEPIFDRDIIRSLVVSSLAASQNNVYMYTKDEVNQKLSGKIVTGIGVPIMKVNNFAADSYFMVYVIDSVAPYTRYEEHKILIPANRFSSNTVNRWVYFNVNIELKEGQTLAFQSNSSATVGFVNSSHSKVKAVLSEFGGFQNITNPKAPVPYEDFTVLYDIFVK